MRINYKYLLFLSILMSCNSDVKERLTNPRIEGFVPNENVARKIAEAVLVPIYGEGIYQQMPFRVELKNDSIWVLNGSDQSLKGKKGGTAYIEINKRDGRILAVTHYK